MRQTIRVAKGEPLTFRQQQILVLLYHELTGRRVAKRLGISESMVSREVKAIQIKLGLVNWYSGDYYTTPELTYLLRNLNGSKPRSQ